MKGRVLLVGCGNIGSRHLQAVASLKEVAEIEVVDPRPEALRLGRDRLLEIADLNPAIKIRWLVSLGEASPHGGVCIVATQAKGRYALVKQIFEELGYRLFLLEKIVTQSVKEYEDLTLYAQQHHLVVWVNCKTRTYPFHVQARAKISTDGPIQFSVIAGNHGLASNGIHSVDLFAYYDQSRSIAAGRTVIDPVLYPLKRGGDLFDLSGTIQAYSDKGSLLILSFAQGHLAPPCYFVSSRSYRFIVDQWGRWGYDSDAESNWTWRSVPFEGNLLISAMSKRFVGDILSSGRCELPTLEEHYSAHAFLVRELQPHFNKLLNREMDHCPVT